MISWHRFKRLLDIPVLACFPLPESHGYRICLYAESVLNWDHYGLLLLSTQSCTRLWRDCIRNILALKTAYPMVSEKTGCIPLMVADRASRTIKKLSKNGLVIYVVFRKSGKPCVNFFLVVATEECLRKVTHTPRPGICGVVRNYRGIKKVLFVLLFIRLILALHLSGHWGTQACPHSCVLRLRSAP
jgi:hypothetical protein